MSNPKILVADDSLTIQKVIRITLAKSPYQLIECTKETELISLIEKSEVDLLILDFNFFEAMNGYDLSKKILSISPHLKIIIMHNNFSIVDLNKLKSAGVYFKIIKPFQSSVFIETCKEAINSSFSTNIQQPIPTPKNNNLKPKSYNQNQEEKTDKISDELYSSDYDQDLNGQQPDHAQEEFEGGMVEEQLEMEAYSPTPEELDRHEIPDEDVDEVVKWEMSSAAHSKDNSAENKNESMEKINQTSRTQNKTEINELDTAINNLNAKKSFTPKSKLIPIEELNYSADEEEQSGQLTNQRLKDAIEDETDSNQFWAIDNNRIIDDDNEPNITNANVMDVDSTSPAMQLPKQEDSVLEFATVAYPSESQLELPDLGPKNKEDSLAQQLELSRETKDLIEQQIKELLQKQCREIIQNVAWKVIPQLAEKIIGQELNHIKNYYQHKK